MKASDLMQTDHLWACSVTSDCRQAAQMMAENDIGALPVLDADGRLEGILTDRDITIRLVAQGRSFETPVSEIMSKPVRTVHADADAKEVEAILEQHKIRRLPVVDDQRRLQGWISLADMAHRYHGMFKEHRLAEVLETVSTP